MNIQNKKSLIDKFREYGYKVTPQRLAIFEFINERTDHPSADLVFSELKKDFPTISQATIYNTLHILQEIGEVHELGFKDGKTRYDPDTTVHVNLVCKSCGKILDFTDEQLEEAWSRMVKKTGVRVAGQRLDLYYDCEDCSNNL